MRHFILSLFAFICFQFPNQIFAQSENALDFDGIDDQVTVGTAAPLIFGTSQFSMAMWVYPRNASPSFPNFDGFAGYRNDIDADFYLLQLTTNSVEARFRNSSGVAFDIVHNGLQLNTWQHFVFTYDGTMTKLYRNGLPVDSIAANGAIGGGFTPFYLGFVKFQNTDFLLNGKLDEVSLWSRTLSATEIQCIYNHTNTTNDPGLKMCFRFNQGTAGGNNGSTTTLISTSGSHNATLSNFALTGSTSNWVQGVNNATIINDTICPGQSYTFGTQTITMAGTYNRYVSLFGGCDSLIKLNLYVIPFSKAVTQSGITITATQTAAAYQWVDCNDGFALISGAIAQSYTATANGSYAVIVSKNGCSDTSTCTTISSVGIAALANGGSSNVYPNPFTEELILSVNEMEPISSLRIYNMLGHMIWSKENLTQGLHQIPAEAWPSGVYFLHTKSVLGRSVFKLVK